MRQMTSKEIKDHFGDFTEAARRETIVHTSHGRPTLVTISVDRARTIPELSRELSGAAATDKAALLERLQSFSGAGIKLVGKQTAADIDKRSRIFRGNDE